MRLFGGQIEPQGVKMHLAVLGLVASAAAWRCDTCGLECDDADLARIVICAPAESHYDDWAGAHGPEDAGLLKILDRLCHPVPCLPGRATAQYGLHRHPDDIAPVPIRSHWIDFATQCTSNLWVSLHNTVCSGTQGP